MLSKSFLHQIVTNKAVVLHSCKNAIIEKNRFLLTYLNQHSFNISYQDQDFKNLLENEFKVYLDGMGMYLALKFLGQNINYRFNASEINEQIFSILVNEGTPIVLIGGRFPHQLIEDTKLNVAKYFNGYEDVENGDNIIDHIKVCGVKTIIIGMSVPLQEKLAFEISNRINNIRIICVGNFLEFYFGTILRAPRILHNSGFEWLFRMLTEPKRLWERYLLGIPIFLCRIIKMKLSLYR